jgi:2-succinyl-5-enolpyruvyl-6-hydroxy-3-cyclohexene-1-carboxylate synthase|tara:strand:+ start:1061 stop:1657 length:597 start_codon:yes stop_codon:yes gene_type:complete
VKITKNQLKELVQQSIEEMIEGGPGSGRKGGGDTTGGPSYANVPKGAKTSKDAKKMKKKKKSLGTSIASKFQKQIDKYNKARKQTPKGLKRVTKESKGKKTTVKEIKQWMKKLEENRYRKVVNADARRVAWLVNNNLAEDYDEMPKSIRKKWSEAKYGRERYLANEFIKHLESKQLSENKLRTMIRNTIKEVVNGKKK